MTSSIPTHPHTLRCSHMNLSQLAPPPLCFPAYSVWCLTAHQSDQQAHKTLRYCRRHVGWSPTQSGLCSVCTQHWLCIVHEVMLRCMLNFSCMSILANHPHCLIAFTLILPMPLGTFKHTLIVAKALACVVTHQKHGYLSINNGTYILSNDTWLSSRNPYFQYKWETNTLAYHLTTQRKKRQKYWVKIDIMQRHTMHVCATPSYPYN